MSKRFHLAQINIARMRAPLDDPAMAGFVAQLDPVNALAEASPGFVWRLQTDDGDATSLRVFEDPLILVNMSVWESVGDLQAFAYRSHHVTVFQDRGKWFEPFGGVSKALWWIPAGEVPTVEDARKRLAFLSDYGESPIAFSFARQFPAPPVQAIDYDKRTFVSRVNSANGDADERTVFHYGQRNDTVWATYEGGNVDLRVPYLGISSESESYTELAK